MRDGVRERAVKQWDADKLGCVLETSWHSYRQTVVGARQMLLDCPESSRLLHFFPPMLGTSGPKSGPRGKEKSEKNDGRLAGLLLVLNTILTELDDAMFNESMHVPFNPWTAIPSFYKLRILRHTPITSF